MNPLEKFYIPNCNICPFKCNINREEKRGVCNAPHSLYIASATLHPGEEPPISGWQGSGTIFLSYCSLKCVYCQNYPISQYNNGREISIEELADIMIKLQKRGAHNINFVTPTHYTYQIVESIIIARKKGLKIPIVWNTSGYERVEVIKELDPFVDIYLVDARYSDDKLALKYSYAPNYTQINRDAIKEMFKQKGILKTDKNGIATKGIIIRHLVMPNFISGTEDILKFISNELSKECYISLMAQYYPSYKTDNYPEINRRITHEEWNKALELLEKYELYNGWTQELSWDY